LSQKCPVKQFLGLWNGNKLLGAESGVYGVESVSDVKLGQELLYSCIAVFVHLVIVKKRWSAQMFVHSCKLQLSDIEGLLWRFTAWSSETSSEWMIPWRCKKKDNRSTWSSLLALTSVCFKSLGELEAFIEALLLGLGSYWKICFINRNNMLNIFLLFWTWCRRSEQIPFYITFLTSVRNFWNRFHTNVAAVCGVLC
jgi:hypothetical protein